MKGWMDGQTDRQQDGAFIMLGTPGICRLVCVITMAADVLASIVLFHTNFSTSGEQPEYRKLAHEL